MEGSLVVLVLEDTVKVDVEQVRRVERATLGFRVELGAEDGTRLVDHALVARVVQVGEVRLPVVRQGRHVDSIAVVLAGDVAATSAHVQSRDVVSPVTVLELDGASASSQSQQLVTQANTKDGHLRRLHQAAQVVGGGLAVSRVTGTVGDEDTIEVVSHLVDGEVKGEHGHAGTAVDQAAQDVLLDTTIDDSHVTLGVTTAHMEGSLGADLANKVNLLRVGEGLILIGIVLFTDGDAGQRGSLLTQIGDDGASVNARNGGDALASAPFPKALDGSPVAVPFGHVGHDHTGSLQVGRLKVLEQAMLVLFERRHTVVPNERLGEDQDLTPVGRVGQGLGVTHERGGENSLPRDVGAGSKGLTVEDRTISDRKRGPFRGRLLRHRSGHETGLETSFDGREGRGPGGQCLAQTSGEHYVAFFSCLFSFFLLV